MSDPLQRSIDALHVREIEANSPWYVPPKVHFGENKPKLPPLAQLRAELLNSSEGDRFLLSGHIGSGKSTEIKRLLLDPKIRQRFYVVAFDIQPTDRPSLTSHHLLFLIAAELYGRAREDAALTVFDKKDRWLSILKRMDQALFGVSGLVAEGGKFGLEFDLFFVKLKQELSLSDGRRVEFRQFAETHGGVLVDLIDLLVEDIGNALVAAGLPHRVLVAIDDLEKLSHADQFAEIFGKNIGAFRAPRVPILATVPPSITFDGAAASLGSKITHLRPIQVLKKTNVRDPMKAIDPDGVAFLKQVLLARVEAGVFEDGAIEEAAVYSGGVMRDYFRILRSAAILAQVYEEDRVTTATFGDALTGEINDLTRTLYPKDKEAFREIRQNHVLNDPSQLDYMRISLVLEYNHDGIWWEVTPMVWDWLERR